MTPLLQFCPIGPGAHFVGGSSAGKLEISLHHGSTTRDPHYTVHYTPTAPTEIHRTLGIFYTIHYYTLCATSTRGPPPNQQRSTTLYTMIYIIHYHQYPVVYRVIQGHPTASAALDNVKALQYKLFSI